MFQMKDEMQTAVKHNIRGGEGSPSFRYLFSADQLGGRAEMIAVITLQPGESVGVHPHETNGEAYVILEGAATVTEDGQARELHVGDAEFCADGKRLIAAADSLLRRSLHCFHRYDRISIKHL